MLKKESEDLMHKTLPQFSCLQNGTSSKYIVYLLHRYGENTVWKSVFLIDCIINMLAELFYGTKKDYKVTITDQEASFV